MKHFLMNKEGEGSGAGGGAAGPDVAKQVADGFKALKDEIANLNKKIEAKAAPAPAPKKKEAEEEDDLGTELLVNPKKAVQKLTASIREQVEGSMATQETSKNKFFERFSELTNEYPELGQTNSELHMRAKELLASKSSGSWDINALDSAVLAAVSEKGVVSAKHRKTAEDDSDEGEYLGSGSRGSNNGNRRRGSSNDKLDPKTAAFAEMCGLNVKDPKVVERLAKHQNDRRGKWNKYS